jgi:lipid-A-disaccharide synthase
VALPNILTEQALVPEFIQDHATPEALTDAALAWLSEPQRVADYQQTASQWRARLAADDLAAKRVLAFIEP